MFVSYIAAQDNDRLNVTEYNEVSPEYLSDWPFFQKHRINK